MKDTKLSIDELIDIAKKYPRKVVVPGANNDEAMEAIYMAQQDGVINGGLLFGNKDLVTQAATHAKVCLTGFEIINTQTDAESAQLAAKSLATGKGDFLLKGQVDTKTFLKAVLDKELGLVPPGRTLTHLAVLSIPSYHKFLFTTDAAILIEPQAEDKIKMIDNIVEFAHNFGIKCPKVSIQAAVEKINPKMRSTTDAETIVKMASEGRFANALVEGPHDIYIATSLEGAQIKKVSGKVCGDADILIFNDINCANAFYKGMLRFVPNMWAAGLVLGATKPILLPSRADDALTKRMSILLAAYLGAKKQSN